jgi:hypothetical protein
VVEDLIDMFGSSSFLACASDSLGVGWGQVLVILGVKQMQEFCWLCGSHFFVYCSLILRASVVFWTKRHAKPLLWLEFDFTYLVL